MLDCWHIFFLTSTLNFPYCNSCPLPLILSSVHLQRSSSAFSAPCHRAAEDSNEILLTLLFLRLATSRFLSLSLCVVYCSPLTSVVALYSLFFCTPGILIWGGNWGLHGTSYLEKEMGIGTAPHGEIHLCVRDAVRASWVFWGWRAHACYSWRFLAGCLTPQKRVQPGLGDVVWQGSTQVSSWLDQVMWEEGDDELPVKEYNRRFPISLKGVQMGFTLQ